MKIKKFTKEINLSRIPLDIDKIHSYHFLKNVIKDLTKNDNTKSRGTKNKDIIKDIIKDGYILKYLKKIKYYNRIKNSHI